MSEDRGVAGQQEIAFYTTPAGTIVEVDVRFDVETVVLSLNQIAVLFGRDKSVISRHLRRIFAEGELDRSAVVAKNATTAADGKTYWVEYFDLDAILAVGYRVNSKEGAQFRKWATKTLRDHLIKGYTVSQRRLDHRDIIDLEETVRLLSRTLRARQLVRDEGEGLLDVVNRYVHSWRLLLQYDENRLPAEIARPTRKMQRLTPVAARKLVLKLKNALAGRGEASDIFGVERGDGLDGVLGSIEQTFDGAPLYASVEARAAHLLYFVIKDHPFTDGNKRIGSLLFLRYLDVNKRLEDPHGRPRFDDRALVALALLIAESDPQQKDLMTRLVMNLLEDPPP